MEDLLKDFADEIAFDIPSKKNRDAVRDELLDHLISNYSDYIDAGYTKEEAYEKTIKGFGDKDKIRRDMAKQYPFNPHISMKSATILLIIGFIVSSFKINLFQGMEQITDFVASVITLTGMFALSKNGGKIQKAFYINLAQTIVAALSYASQIFYINIGFISGTIHVILSILGLISWFWLIDGLRELTEPFDKYKKIPYNTNKVLYAVFIFGMNLLSAIAAYTGDNIDINLPVFTILFIIAIIVVIFAGLKMFVNVHRVLERSEHDYITEDNSDKKKEFAFSIIAFALIFTLICNICYINQPVKYLKPDKDTYELSDSQREYITSTMMTYGESDEDIADLKRLIAYLPDSEIAKLDRILPYDEQPYEGFSPILKSYNGPFVISTYVFILNNREAYIARKINLEDGENLNTRFALNFSFGNIIRSIYSSCYIYNNKTNEMIRPFTEKRDYLDLIKTIEYKINQDTTALITDTICLDAIDTINIQYKLCWFKLPICGINRNLTAEAEKMDIQAFTGAIDSFGFVDMIKLYLYSDDDYEDELYDIDIYNE